VRQPGQVGSLRFPPTWVCLWPGCRTGQAGARSIYHTYYGPVTLRWITS